MAELPFGGEGQDAERAWRLLVVPGDRCTDPCRKAVFNLRQLHARLNKDAGRVRRALVLLSDGEDTASTISYRDALEFARRSGVAIYTIGLNIGSLDFDVRKKLNELSKETGGRTFMIKKAQDLVGVYDDIEDELRSQYLLAFSSDRPAAAGDDAFRSVVAALRAG